MSSKKSYEDISIPAQLDNGIDHAAQHATRRKWRKRLGMTAVTTLVLLAGVANTPVYAQAIHIPIVGTVIRVLRIGQGGQQTDGLTVSAQEEAQTVQLQFLEGTKKVTNAPIYEAVYVAAPNRVVLTLHGVRFGDRNAVCEQLKQADGVQDAYFAMLLDDSACQIVVELKEGYTYTIAEQKEPAGLAITFTPAPVQKPETVYYLRSEPMPYGESLGILCEQLAPYEPQQVKMDTGDFVVVVGMYTSEEEAKAAQEQISDVPLTVVSGQSNARPSIS